MDDRQSIACQGILKCNVILLHETPKSAWLVLLYSQGQHNIQIQIFILLFWSVLGINPDPHYGLPSSYEKDHGQASYSLFSLFVLVTLDSM